VFNEHKECLLRMDDRGRQLLIYNAIERRCPHLAVPESSPGPNPGCP